MRRLPLLLLILLLAATAMRAETQPAPPVSASVPGGAAQAETASAPAPKVIKAINRKHAGDLAHVDYAAAGIGDVMVVEVENLSTLLNQSACLNAGGAKITGCVPQEVGLFLEGRLIKGLIPESKVLRGTAGSLQFHLERTAENDEAWSDLLGGPKPGKTFFKSGVSVSVGLVNGSPVETEVGGKGFQLVRIRPNHFMICTGLMLVLIALVLCKGKTGTLLRDPGPVPDGGRPRPYSLARFQMAFWFILVVASFLYIWQVTGASETITPGILALVGIGSATVLGANSIDENRRNEKLARMAELKAETAVLGEALSLLPARIAASPDAAEKALLIQEQTEKQKRLQATAGELKSLQAQVSPQATEGFLNDVLNDGNGISIHRLQMFTWTFVLGLLFLGSVWGRLSMPDFSATLLGMQGLSAGTYLGFKISEKTA